MRGKKNTNESAFGQRTTNALWVLGLCGLGGSLLVGACDGQSSSDPSSCRTEGFFSSDCIGAGAIQSEDCETCGGVLCVDVARDPAHCGACGQACPSAMVCGGGECVSPCDPSLTLCGSSCTELDQDNDNCGACGHRCAPGSTCSQGVCRCDEEGSGMGGAGGALGTVSFSGDILPLFENTCSGSSCHTGDDRKAPLALDPDEAYDHLVMARSEVCDEEIFVEPGSPDQSYLIDKLSGGAVCSGSRMPLAAPALPVSALRTTVAWICQGAQNN